MSMRGALNTDELFDLLTSLLQASALTEALVLVGCLVLAWGVVRLVRGAAVPMDSIWFESDKRDRVTEYLRGPDAAPYLPALEKTVAVIDGFESPLLMELLATVDWLLTVGMCLPTVEDLRAGLAEWPEGKTAGSRKLKLFDDRLLGLAIDRLTDKRQGTSA